MLWRYGIALVTVAGALALGLALHAPDSEIWAALFLLVAVAVTAHRGGMGPGTLAVVLAAIAGEYTLAPQLNTPRDFEAMLLRALVFVAGGTLVALVASRRAHRRGVRAAESRRRSGAAADARFRGLLEAAPDALVTADRGGTILLVNSRTEKLFGYTRDELLGQPISLLLPATETSADGQLTFGNIDPIPPATELNLVGRRKDGTDFPAEVSLSVLETDGEVMVTGVIRDVTDRRRAEDERATFIREQAARLSAESAERRAAFLAEASRVLAGSLDYQTTLASVARLAVPQLADWCAVDVVDDDGSIRALAVAHADGPGTEWARAVRERYRVDEQAPHGVAHVVRTGRSQIYANVPEALLPSAAPDAEQVEALRVLGAHSAMIVPMMARERTLGAITFVVGQPARQYGPHDLAFAEELARHAALAVENSSLYASAQRERAGAEAANRMKDEFLATLSHELRTPLNAMLGWIRLLLTGALDEAATQRAHETIDRNARAQAQVIDDLLDVSRMITGQLRLDVQAVNLGPIVEDAVEAVRPAANAKHLKLNIVLDPGAAPVSGDRDRLRQVFWNLLSNAVKFTPAGGRVHVRLARTGSSVEVTVSDNGIGIEPQFLPFVFDRFRQADPSTTRAYGGLGLGLAVVRHLVELHGGSVRVHSGGANSGTMFTVDLPLRAVKGGQLYLAGDRGSDASASDDNALPSENGQRGTGH